MLSTILLTFFIWFIVGLTPTTLAMVHMDDDDHSYPTSAYFIVGIVFCGPFAAGGALLGFTLYVLIEAFNKGLSEKILPLLRKIGERDD